MNSWSNNLSNASSELDTDMRLTNILMPLQGRNHFFQMFNLSNDIKWLTWQT